MSDETSVTAERQSPEAAFGLLSSDLRVAILRALGDADGALSFSELRERVEVVDSGKFNYHLGKLAGHFVTQTGGGYELSLAGRQVYGAILSGRYTADATVDPFAFDGPCPLCGHADLVAEYVDERARLYCPECEVWRNEFSFPPASLDQFDREALPAAFDRWMRATVARILQGFCANCGGRVDGRLEPDDGDSPMSLSAVFDCERCGDELQSAPMLPVIFHPVAIGFFEAHGVDVFADPSWRFFDAGDDVDVTETEDGGARVRLVVDGDELTATVEADVSVTDVAVAD
ncbi:winged helix-turn-helix domain-containing protein [Halobacterium litoreum]|uniref:ArsR family transcriptional regulator n=1 Tax=Halobacterium litoreum TaxID=2039234 RepID=A0ABD5NFC7_9EURY|nr:helix-turn-helix domain-containing protein [Halobacterium litoreum]UHH13177.1 helix-turn-helix domain-containing protein [Halobacterium litoreum]